MTKKHWPLNGLEAVHACPVCGTKDRTLLYSDLTDNVLYCAPGEWTLFRCENCCSAYLDPRPSADAISLAYQNYYTHNVAADESDKKNLTIAKLFRVINRGYLDWKYHRPKNLAGHIGAFISFFLPSRRRKLLALSRGLARANQDKTLLDFGCGNGDFLLRAERIGYRAIGIDFDPAAVDVAKSRGLQAYHGDMSTIQALGYEFDVITLAHVIEHVHDVEELLRNCFQCLRPGGTLWLETPNIDAQGHSVYGAHWRGLEPPRHLTIFSTRGLTSLLSSSKYCDIELMPEHPAVRDIFDASEQLRRSYHEINNLKTRKKNKIGFPRMYYARRSFKDSGIREFITIRAKRPNVPTS